MTVFKAYLKVLNKNKFAIILYTIILIFFSAFNLETSEENMNFVATKPDILIINKDEEKGLTKNLITYIKNNSNIIEIDENEAAIRDALFYRDVNYIVYIPKNYREDFLNKKNPEIEIKKTGDYNASLAEMLLDRYLKTASIYLDIYSNEEELIKNLNKTLDTKTEVQIVSKLDTTSLNKATFYFNFLNYSLLAGLIFVICMVLLSFKNVNIHKRTVISSMDYKQINKELFISNLIFGFLSWLFYIALGIIIIGKVMFTTHGLIYILNSFVFLVCAISIALLIGNLVSNKNTINGIVNVVALGSSFLCGAFVPMEFLPNFVLKIAHILPSYWYMKTNEMLKSIDKFNLATINSLITNMLILIIFTIIFTLITRVVTSKKRKLN